ncbi:MAG: MFS transporter [Ignavibacteriales bacterium]|nr:MFS transporter [Ignavibacteriales bacterium]
MTEEKLKTQKNKNPWSWIPTLYFAEGLPYAIVITVSVIMYKRLGISNADIALYTSWLYLPWVIKPLWSPIVDVLKTKRVWIYTMQLLIGAGMAGVAFTIPMPDFFQFTLAFFWLIAFSSATHDISADGFYMLALSESQQSFFVGIRSTFYRVAMIAGQGLLVIFAGYLESTLALEPAELKVVANPNKFFEETIKIDSISAKQLQGNLRLIANPSYLEISTRPQTRESADFYSNFAHNFNIMNGFIKEPGVISDTTTRTDLVGNIGIMKFYLSKQPGKDNEYIVNLDYIVGNYGIKVIEGKSLKFTAYNWNKPAFAVFQLDSTIAKKTEATFKAQVNRVPLAWVFTFAVVGVLFVLFFIYHKTILPKPVSDKHVGVNRQSSVIKEFFRTFFRFFEKKKIIIVIAFLLLFHFGEAQLVKMAAPFMLDNREIGGLGLTTSDVGFIYGTIGIIALIIGGLLGGFAISRKGLRFWIWPMLIAINVPDLLYVYLAYTQPVNIWIIYSCVAVEQFGYGFGFTAYIMYMIYVSEGEYKTSHYAIATGFMALGMMLPGMISGLIQEAIGYKFFFVWVVIAAIPSFLIAKFIPLEYQFGKKKLTE